MRLLLSSRITQANNLAAQASWNAQNAAFAQALSSASDYSGSV